MSVFPDGAFHALPHPVGSPGVLAAILAAVPAFFSPTDELVFTTPIGHAFASVVQSHVSTPARARSSPYVLPVGAPAVAQLLDVLAQPARAGAVYTQVYRGDIPLLECEESYDWLWLSAALPPAWQASFLAEIRRRLEGPMRPTV